MRNRKGLITIIITPAFVGVKFCNKQFDYASQIGFTQRYALVFDDLIIRQKEKLFKI